MALNIAASQIMANPVDQFLEGRAIRRAEAAEDQQMQMAQAAEGRAVTAAEQQAKRFDWEREDTENKFDQANGQRVLARLQQTRALPKDQRKPYIEQEEPEFIAELEAKTGQAWADLDDDEIEGMMNMLERKISGDLGIAPSKPAPFSDAGKVSADVRSGLLTGEQGDAILNAAEYTAPEAGIVDGKEVVYQANKKTGDPRIIPGVTPRPQKPLVSIDQSGERSFEVEFNKGEAGDFRKVLDRGQNALDKAQSIRVLLQSPAKTGPTQDIRASANAFFKDLGVPIAQSKVDQIANLEQYKGVLSQSVLSEQLKQIGPQTESDARRIEATFGNTKNINEANELILKYQLALAEREAILADKAEAFRERVSSERGGKIDGWRKELRQYVRDTPLAAKNPKSGRLVFWNEFYEQVKAQKPDATEQDIMNRWRNYASR